jgi:hypothetical protein
MDEFELEIEAAGETILFPAKLLLMGYTHKIEVDVHGVPVLFEPDEERNYRALVMEEHRNKINARLLQQLAEAIERVVK